MRIDGNGGGRTSYEPNSRGEWIAQPDFAEPPLAVEGAADRWNHREDTDYYSQPGDLFRQMTPAQKSILFENTARAIKGATPAVVARHIGNCTKADPAYGAGVAEAIARLD
jgi:catalase